MVNNTIRVGGLISGLDVNSVVDALIKAESYRLKKIEKDKDYQLVRRDVYKSIGEIAVSLRNLAFSMKLLSTYNSTKALSSNTSFLDVTAKSGASWGNYTVRILQLAEPSKTYSLYPLIRVVSTTIPDFSVAGRSTETVEGTDTLVISYDGSKYALDANFKLLGRSYVSAYVTGAIEDSTNAGTIGVDVASGSALSFVYGGRSASVSIDSAYVKGVTSIYDVAKDLEVRLNRTINDLMGTKGITYVMVRVDAHDGAGNDKLVVYDVGGEGVSFGGPTAAILGLENTSVEVRDTVSTRIFGNTLSDIKLAIENYVIPGTTVTGSLSVGTVELTRDASLKVQKATPSYVYGARVSSGSGINLNVVGLENAGFAVPPSYNTNGFFTINGVRIYIADYRTLSVNDVIGMINSSGAGVRAYYDVSNDRFVIESLTPGGPIRLGSPYDTSDFLSIAKLSIPMGGTYVQGSSSGKIDPTVPLVNSGLSVTPTGGTFTINGVTLYVDPSKDSLNDLISKINSSASGVTAYYDSGTDKVILVNKSGSNSSFLKLGSSTDTSNILYALALIPSLGGSYEVGMRGQDAVFSVNGITYVRPTNEVTDVIEGLTLYLRGVTGNNTVSVDVVPDTDALVDKFAEFISLYNTIVDKLNPPKLTDDMKEYLEPLSDDKKAKMSQSEIDEYNKKHKEYLSYSIISTTAEFRDFLSKLRGAFSSVVATGSYRSVLDIGFTTNYAFDEDTKNKGYILGKYTDKDKVKELLKNNSAFMDVIKSDPMKLYRLFGGDDGISGRIIKAIDAYFGTSGRIYNYYKPGGYIDSLIASLEKDRINELGRLSEYENMLWQKFSYMEEEIARLQAWSQYLSVQLNSLMGSGSQGRER